MKRLITIWFIAAAVTVSGYAQIGQISKVTSDSHRIEIVKEKKEPKEHTFLIKGDMGMLQYSDFDITLTALKYNIALGYQYQLSKGGFYIGGLVGGSNFGDMCHCGETATRFGLYLEPLIGLKKPIGGNRKLDIHGALGYCHIFTDYTYDHDFSATEENFIFEIGGGVWFNKLYVGLEYQNTEYGTDHGFMLEIGFRF